MADAPLTLIRLRTPINEKSDVDNQMATIVRIPGTILAYLDGQYIISLHDDTHPNSRDISKAKRVRAVKASDR